MNLSKGDIGDILDVRILLLFNILKWSYDSLCPQIKAMVISSIYYYIFIIISINIKYNIFIICGHYIILFIFIIFVLFNAFLLFQFLDVLFNELSYFWFVFILIVVYIAKIIRVILFARSLLNVKFFIVFIFNLLVCLDILYVLYLNISKYTYL